MSGESDRDEKAAKIVALCAAIDAGVAQLDAGLGVETTPDELIDEVLDEFGLTRQG